MSYKKRYQRKVEDLLYVCKCLSNRIMEGTIYNTYENLKTALDLNIKIHEIITSGGPTRSNLWCQIISDITKYYWKRLVNLLY